MIKIEYLIEHAKKGDKDAFSEIISSIYNDLYAIAKLRLNNEDDIQDAIQETFINAYLKLSSLKQNKYFKTWIIKILINECNKINNQKKHNTKLLDRYTFNYSSFVSIQHDGNKIIDFNAIKKILTEKENEIFYIFYEQD